MGSPIVERVRAIATRLAGPERTPPDANADTSLGEGGFSLDSLELLELIVACEEQFAIVFEPETGLTRASLRTVGSLAAAVAERRGSG